jgi:hypothetical protein
MRPHCAISGLHSLWLICSVTVLPRAQTFFSRRIKYLLIIQRLSVAELTRWQAFVILAYLVLNSLALSISVQGARDLGKRAAIVAALNITPLFLLEPTSLLARFLRISMPTYQLAHYWIGGMVVLEVVVHSVIAIALRLRSSPITTSGAIVSVSVMKIHRTF